LPVNGCQTDRMTESTGDSGTSAAGQRLLEEARRLREVPELDLIAFAAGQDGPLLALQLFR
jgi:hypothetical protein